MTNKIIVILIAFLLGFLAEQRAPNTYTLVKLSQERGAACLDGSPAGFYINQGIGANKTKYMIYFNGGGFCAGMSLSQTIESCYQRSKTSLGTTNVSKPQTTFDGKGVLSTNPQQNPHFYDWTKVFVIYCDGACHQGYRQQPIPYKDAILHFRGTRNVLQFFKFMDTKYDFYNGDAIVITGVSAGGMASYQWSNYVLDNSKRAKVYSIPDSGLFITNFYSPIVDQKVVAEKILNLLKLVSTDTSQLPQPVRLCLSQGQFAGDYVACFDSGNYGKYLRTHMLIVQSPYDEWSLSNILVVKCLTNTKPPYSLSACNDSARDAIQQYRSQVISQLHVMKGHRSDIGGWGPSCVQHGFIDVPSLTNTSFRIPSSIGPTLNDMIGIFLKKPLQAPWLVELVKWPGNRGCSGMTNNLKFDEF